MTPSFGDPFNDEIAQFVHPTAQARFDVDRCVRLLQNGGRLNDSADRQIEPRPYLCVAPGALYPYFTRVPFCLFDRGFRPRRERRKVQRRAAADRRTAQRHDADRQSDSRRLNDAA